ncbi:hypothetical protein SAMN06265365_1622 [Tistlia consotensis]|uniref:Adenylate kinase n=1 Tax=Tistlia consotensis USBA 355 TaxID=560819 RepID=A0A1Y6CRD9_9PROT|nr:AAA family ATPase [Tistlia consotensis]SMF85381.1 hypothetical protein SAMN05428998_1631 [Tistlia consotensis USBA 355]SNS39095.1 hypothetical protein SAMN06265365_1622 [Tistlia consotensis]
MARIHVTGNAGSGKTTLARQIGEALDLPVYGLDRLVWHPGWKKSPRAWREAREAELIAKPDWVIDGVSAPVREAADLLIFLDASRLTCFGRCARRNWRYLWRSRPDLPPNCPELLVIPKLAKIIWSFPAKVRPEILTAIEGRRESAYIVRGRTELESLFHDLGIGRL